ncbi:MAG TPA: hypothetical protein PKZ68_09690, partial [Pseudomonadales bacterium]|nr:hypothetical protein [Pseudomonadales bacterium]
TIIFSLVLAVGLFFIVPVGILPMCLLIALMLSFVRGKVVVGADGFTTSWLSEADDKRINHMTRHIMKAKWIGTNRERLEKIEDKYIFDIHDMRQLAKDAGFSAMEYCNVEMTEKGYRHYVNQHLLMEGLAPDTIQQFAFIANAYMSTIGEMTPRDIVTPMGYFIFRK